ncbi:hypothetical protein DFJ74DRAFT_299822 [Hyaloraphidium curvatum]|nr:hypothetical protein DFJ74DRAFT_299822 [Hyaloraphidium curvatum]
MPTSGLRHRRLGELPCSFPRPPVPGILQSPVPAPANPPRATAGRPTRRGGKTVNRLGSHRYPPVGLSPLAGRWPRSKCHGRQESRGGVLPRCRPQPRAGAVPLGAPPLSSRASHRHCWPDGRGDGARRARGSTASVCLPDAETEPRAHPWLPIEFRACFEPSFALQHLRSATGLGLEWHARRWSPSDVDFAHRKPLF